MSRVAGLAIQEAAKAGDIETLSALLSSQEERLSSMTVQEAQEAAASLREARDDLAAQMREVQKELAEIRSRGRVARQYKSSTP